MTLSAINSIIANFAAAPGTVTLVRETKSPLIQGRRALPTFTLVALTDVAHHPAQDGDVNVRSNTVGTDEWLTVYTRTAVLPAVVEPGGSDPWWLIVDGVFYVAERVEPWKAGGFWAAQCRRHKESRAMMPVWFGIGGIADVGTGVLPIGDLPACRAAVLAALIGATVHAGLAAFVANGILATTTSAELRNLLVTSNAVFDANSDDGDFDDADIEAVVAAFEANSKPALPFDPNVVMAYAPSRSFRFHIDADDLPAQDGSSVIWLFAAWPQEIQQPSSPIVLLQRGAATVPADLLQYDYVVDGSTFHVAIFKLELSFGVDVDVEVI